MKDKNYWEQYYKSGKGNRKPSDFAILIKSNINTKDTIIDIGAGSFDDSVFLSKDNKVTAIEPNNFMNTRLFNVIKIDMDSYFKENNYFDVAYARWFIHSIDENAQIRFLNWVSSNTKMVCIESRPEIGAFESEHYRRFIDTDKLIRQLQDRGFSINFFLVGQGLSKRGSDDPVLFRLIAQNMYLSNLRVASGIMKKLKVKFILDGGSLLGSYREKKAIKGDYDDIDFVCFDEKKREEIKKEFIKMKFILVKDRETMMSLKRGSVKLDFFFPKEEGDKYYITLYHQKRPFALQVPKKYWDKLSRVNYYHSDFYSPKDTEGYLTHRYGNWRKPILRPNFSFENYINKKDLTKWL